MAAACIARRVVALAAPGVVAVRSCSTLVPGGKGIWEVATADNIAWQRPLQAPSPQPSPPLFSPHSAQSAAMSTSRYKVYTKTGDKGESSLYNGERRSKHDEVFAALGDTDELNSAIGVAREFCLDADNGLPTQLEAIQSLLLDIGSAVATPQSTSSERKKSRVEFDEAHVDMLEGWIDMMDEELPQLTTFILPSGGKAASFLHLARTVCRRAERSVVPLVQSEQTIPVVGHFLNRLSDYLFTAARYAAHKEGKMETTYKKA